MLFDIKRFAINDGPGIRTTVFMKGCPLRCIWCHNPEGISEQAVKLYTKKKCIGCMTCVEACPNHALTLTPDGIRQLDGCTLCGRCTDECPTLALEMAGKHWEMDELMRVIEKERKVMEDSGGGITFCGGEPLMQPAYLEELLREVGKRGFHRTVDTTLFCSESVLNRIIPLCELFLVDLKHMNPERHKEYTGVSNERILYNIRILSQTAHPYWIRIPLIDGINCDDENLLASARFLSSLPYPPEVVNLLVYHDIGIGKHARLGSTYNPDSITMNPPSTDLQNHALEIFTAAGLNTRIGG